MTGAFLSVMHKTMASAFFTLILVSAPSAAEPVQETVSFSCGLAIDAVIAEMDSQAGNPVTQEALGKIDEKTGEFVCITTDESTIYVRLQSVDMQPVDNKLVFTVDTGRYRVLKTYYGP
ncbi:MAG: hypothetical protein OEN02_06440 [Gammaproteobacteria bacterium]|nr:hypothetical protein [Gammaproteobacteria bacterium]